MRQVAAAGGRWHDLKLTAVEKVLTSPEAAGAEGHCVPGSSSQKCVKGLEGHLP